MKVQILQLPQPIQQTQMQFGAKQDPNQINQATLIMSLLEPLQISQLIHSSIPIFGKQYNYHLDVANQMKLSSEGRVNLPMQNIIRSVSLTWFSQIGKAKTPLQDETDLSQKIVKLYEPQSETHQRIVNKNELSAYHKTFSNDENMAIALLVHAQTMKQRNDDSFQWTQLTDEVTKNIQLNVFDALERLVENNRTKTIEVQKGPFTQQNHNQNVNQELSDSFFLKYSQPPKAFTKPQMSQMQQSQLPQVQQIQYINSIIFQIQVNKLC
ncbi:Conserved_hypothetical protein [Hexamita inflata]|uniref:Uncharacterized protein n=1 Tax=Hexamita inflata TaxID=28002 RepID=A0ABP1I0D5_9EUKA